MLATESAQGLFGYSDLASSLHTRSHINPPSYTSSGRSSQSRQNTMPSNSLNVSSGQNGPSQSPIPLPNGFPQQDDNIMNQRADPNSSLYQICLGLRARLAEVPEFQAHITAMEEEEEDSHDTSDPVTSMWNCFRLGYPLMTIYNALRPAVPLKVDRDKIGESKIGKAATFKFLQACMAEQKFPPNECFLITDLYGGDTTGFVKVTKVVNRVLDILSRKGLLLHAEHHPATVIEDVKPQALTFRQNLIQEIVMTERDYVQHLETLQQFKNEVEESGAIAGDAVHDIFLNLNALLDFQRRFLIRIEQQNSLPEDQQNWGQLFIHYKDSFRVYEPFIANQIRCNNSIMAQWDKLKVAPLSPSIKGFLNTQHILAAFLLKPFQRLSKYPMLLNILREKGGLDEERKADLAEGAAAAESILHRANDAIAKEQRIEAVAELQSRVEDWKGHKLEHFGDLLLYGSFTVLKGEGAKEVEREVRSIFDSQNPECRAIIRRSCPQVPSLQFFHPSKNGMAGYLAPMERKSPLKFQSELEDVPEEILRKTEEESLTQAPLEQHSIVAFADCTSPLNSPKISPQRSIRRSPRRVLFSKTTRVSPKAGSSKISPRTPTTPSTLSISENSSQISLIKPGGFDGVDSSQLHTPSRIGKARAPGALGKFGNSFLKSRGDRKLIGNSNIPMQICDCFLYQFNGTLKPSTSFLFSDALAPAITKHVTKQKKTLRDKTIENIEFRPSNLEKYIANEMGLIVPVRVQYKVYLFQRILLCCKEINPNKPKNKMLGTNKPLTDKKGKLRLQLKGRIFMQNVTDVVSFKNDKPLYTIQIFWKGDPGVENFVIRFTTEELMVKWRDQVTVQKQELSSFGRGSGQVVTSDNKFTSMEGQPSLENPYLEDDPEEDDSQGSTLIGGQDNFTSRNASSSSLRSTATLAGATILPLDRNINRAPPRFPHSDLGAVTPALSGLTLHTNIPPGAESPGEFAGSSYFSPVADSPGSTRSSAQAYMYPFPPQTMRNNVWRHDDNKHKTAPAMGRAPSRDGSGTNSPFPTSVRGIQSPSLAPSQNAQHIAMQSRLRSASTPDIHNSNSSGPRRYANGQLQPPVDVPPLPINVSPHIAHMRIPVNRSQTSSPTNGSLPVRSATQSPQLQSSRMPRQPPNPYDYDQLRQQRQQQASIELHSSHQELDLGPTLQIMAPFQASMAQAEPDPLQSSPEFKYPAHLKVTIWFEPPPSHVTIVVNTHIKYQSLADRIDSKMKKITSASIASGTARLRYKDDQDLVKIESDEDVWTAIVTWGEINEAEIRKGIFPDFVLFWREASGR